MTPASGESGVGMTICEGCGHDEPPLSHLSPARGERLEMAARMTRRGLGINVDVIYLGSRPEPALEGLNRGLG